jgi:hypothetical protein
MEPERTMYNSEERAPAENKASLNYVKGLFNLYTERNFAHFLRDNRYVRSSNKLLQINPIFSKSYNLGP